MNVKDIKSPKDIKKLDINELNVLAKDIRSFLIDTLSKTGGHLSSNLGMVEVTIALHYVFDSPKDKILFDVGHQSYIHKILTGRANKFSTLRQYKGISGFQKRNESIYDCYEAGHSSTALSTALGMAVARDLNKKDYNIIPVVGDASMMSGLTLEALNQIGDEKRKLIIIFNDNNMSINKNTGALNKCFAKMRTSVNYADLKDDVKNFLLKGKNGEDIINEVRNIKNSIKKKIINSGLFKEFGIDYIGPIDGHNIEKLISAFNYAKTKNEPCVIHVVTKKGKGYKYAEEDTNGIWHGVPKFDVETGQFLSNKKDNEESYSKIVANAIEKEMANNKDIVCITPAMITGSKLNQVFKNYPDRCFDCGIAEDHAVLFASGLALNNKRPFVSIYSSFLQRAYDQLNHDIARMNLPVVFGIDRSHLVGDDGESHHGIFDITFLRSLPNVIIAEGKDSVEIENLLFSAFGQKSPFFIRYPRGNTEYIKKKKKEKISIGTWEKIINNNNEKCTILTYGEDVNKIKDKINDINLSYNLVNCRFIKPIDKKMLKSIALRKKPIYVYTTDILKGGLCDEVIEFMSVNKYNAPVYCIGIDDTYVEHGSSEKLKKEYKIDIESLFNLIERNINAKKSKH